MLQGAHRESWRGAGILEGASFRGKVTKPPPGDPRVRISGCGPKTVHGSHNIRDLSTLISSTFKPWLVRQLGSIRDHLSSTHTTRCGNRRKGGWAIETTDDLRAFQLLGMDHLSLWRPQRSGFLLLLCLGVSAPNPPGSYTHRDTHRPVVIHSLIRSHVKSHQIQTSTGGMPRE